MAIPSLSVSPLSVGRVFWVQCSVLPLAAAAAEPEDLSGRVLSPMASGRAGDGGSFNLAVEFDHDTASLLESYDEPTKKRARGGSEVEAAPGR